MNDLPPITDYFDEVDLQDGEDDGSGTSCTSTVRAPRRR